MIHINRPPRSVALKLKVSPSTFSRLIKGQSAVSPEMALRLSICTGRSPESWLLMQDTYDLWIARGSVDLKTIEPLTVPA
jgi:addiction module HigA family antidote